MSQKVGVGNSVNSIRSTELERFGPLAELALDMRCIWNDATDSVWRQLDSELWEITHNPWIVLQTVSRDRIDEMLADTAYRKIVDELTESRHETLNSTGWFELNHPKSSHTQVAYFSMEFMLDESLPIYSGGLGNVAGDQLKAASDLGVPVVGIGLLFQQGYFRQVIDRAGYQQALYPYNDPGQLPISPVRQSNGEWLRLEITLPGYSMWLRAWQVQVGRLHLYLLDSNDAANFPAHRGITSELYGGGPELRLQQELILGLGGWRLLEALGIRAEVCHLNEGHAAFAVLERAYSYMRETSLPFEAALAVTRVGNIFTTHTAVAAGFDRFAPELIDQYLRRYARERLGIELADLLALGRRNPNDQSESFSMAYLTMRGCGAVNGVSRLHGEVSRSLFEPLFPRWPQVEVPVGHVTNGVHIPTWQSAAADKLWTDSVGKERWTGKDRALENAVSTISDEGLWNFRTAARRNLIDFARQRLSRQLAVSGMPEAIEAAKYRFNPDALTLGFARRFATYKRPNLLLHNPERLMRILTDPMRPVQLIMAGKAHPEDRTGQELIHQWVEFIRQTDVRLHIIFLSDYDMFLTGRLVQGVDVWINTPQRPWEASGTSGMKALVNGGLNLSELDGWWAEAYTPEVGWALGDGQEHINDQDLDGREAVALYDLLEREIVPEFYTRDKRGVPAAWVKRIRESMAKLTPQYSADRAVREYTEEHYLPAATALRSRTSDTGAIGPKIVDWRRSLDQHWHAIHFGNVTVDSKSELYEISVEVYLDGLDPESIRVELFANGLSGSAPEHEVMDEIHLPNELSGLRVYRANVPATRPAADYTARIVPYFDGVSVPLEDARILWQK